MSRLHNRCRASAVPLLLAALTLCIGGSASAHDDALSVGDFPNAIVRRGCTQEDLPALEILLAATPATERAEPALPFIRIEIASTVSEVVGPELLTMMPLRREINDSRRRVARAELHETGRSPMWLAGSVHLRRVVLARMISGTYSLVAPNGVVYEGAFEATWIPGNVTCG